MKKKNSFIRKAAEYMTLLCSVAFALLLFFPKQTEAAITKQVTQSGFKLSGTETWNYGDYSDENYRYPIYYRGTQTENGMDYKCKVSLTFANKAQTPYYASLYLDDNPIYLDSNGSNVLYTETSFSAEGSLDVLEISFMYKDTPSEDIPFTISMEVQENRKKADLNLMAPGSIYEKTTGTFLAFIDDPYYDSAWRDTSKYSFSISDPSVAKVTGVTPNGGGVDIKVYFLKSGSADLIMNYQGQTKKLGFSVAKTVIYTPGAATLKVGDSTTFANYVTKNGGGSVSIKKLKTSNKKIVSVAGGFITGKKPGTARVSALVNGKRRTIVFTVKKVVPKPSLKQLQVKVKGYQYYPYSRKTYFQTRFTNKSKSTITKVKLRFTVTLNETMNVTKTYKVNLKPGKSKTMRLYAGKLITTPSNIKVKCLRLWYK